MQIEFVSVESLVPYARNARVHTERQIEEIAASIVEWGWTVPVLSDADGIVAGHGRVLAAKQLYAEGVELKLPNGSPIPVGTVPRIDCTGWTEPQRRAYILADNKLAANASWDDALLTLEVSELRELGADLSLVGFSDLELARLAGEADDRYSRNIETPIYQITGEQPALEALVDDTRARALIAKIDVAEAPESVKAFLRQAAQRHVVFDYAAIAEYYAHAPAEVQALMEASALVIIDFGQAIEHGYVRLSERLNEIYTASYGEDLGRDAA